MIDSSELDALVVVMPEDLHHPMVMAGVEAGLHVLCEKPMAFTADRSREMLAAAERARVKHMVQFTNRYAVPRLLHVADGLVSGTAAEFVLLVG
jgi:predicted dehydrogenase